MPALIPLESHHFLKLVGSQQLQARATHFLFLEIKAAIVH